MMLCRKLIYITPFLMFFNASQSFANQASDVTYIVLDKPKQIFQGFGASQTRTGVLKINQNYGSTLVKKMSKEVYEKLGMNWARLWVHSRENVSSELMKYRFYKHYINSGLYNTLKDSGVQKFLLAPARGEEVPRESMFEYANKLARFIADIYKERGIRIDVTGIANEPQGFQHQQIVLAAKYLRQELDRLGMSHVGIIGPEWASADRHAADVLEALQSEPESWDALRGISTHSYNMGANRLIENFALDSNKEYWMTEAGRALPSVIDESPGDTDAASTVAARFLNDMNYSVTHWFWFLGFGHIDKHPNKDSGQVLVKPDDRTGGIKFNTKYFYLKQLRQTFDLGARFYAIVPPKGLRNVWSYGQKPAITLSAAKNPDNSWGIGIVNTTGIPFSNQLMQFYEAKTYSVDILLPADVGNKTFRVYRSRPDGIREDKEILELKNGVLSIDISPHELVTLRSL